MGSIGAYFRDARLRLGKFLVKRFGYRIHWFARLALETKPVHGGFGLEGLDSKLLQIIDPRPNYYIELGANDGVTQSNTLALELAFGWRGLLIEPIESTFCRLRRNRNSRKNFLMRAACVGDKFGSDTVEIIYSNLMSVPIGLDSDIPNPLSHAESGSRLLENGESIRVETVRAVTLTNALRVAKAPTRIGLLSLDVEGAELEVLRGLDFDEYAIEWILVESRNLSRISSYLGEFGYRLECALSAHDFLFTQSNFYKPDRLS